MKINGSDLLFPYLGAKGGEVLISEISSLLHSVDIGFYLEPFCGSAKVFSYLLRDWPERIVSHLNDKNGLISNLWKCIATTNESIKKEFIEKISVSHHSELLHKKAREIAFPYLKNEKETNFLVPNSTVAWATWYLLCSSFCAMLDGVYGVRKKSILDSSQSEPVKFNNYRDAMIQKVGTISDCQVHSMDGLEFLKKFNDRYDNLKLAYIDPPYTGGVLGKSGKVDQGWYGGYGIEELRKLLDFLRYEYKGNFILSNYPSSVLSLYVKEAGWKMKEIEMTCYASKKSRKKIEVLVWNFNPKGQRKLF